jgi:hypothetical protein
LVDVLQVTMEKITIQMSRVCDHSGSPPYASKASPL